MSEAKGGDSDSESVVDKVQEFCLSIHIEEEFEAFCKEYQEIFNNQDHKDSSDEHPMVYYDVYKAYLDRFEGKIEKFILDQGYNVTDFYLECQKILSADDVYSSKRFFVEAILATSEYENFYILIRNEVRKYNRK